VDAVDLIRLDLDWRKSGYTWLEGEVMKLGEEHCRDERNGLDAHPLKPSIGVMRRLRGDEHSACMCGGMWTGNGFARMVGNKLLEHLICTRCGYRWVTDHRSIKTGFAIPR
jgi:hypothetical protein